MEENSTFRKYFKTIDNIVRSSEIAAALQPFVSHITALNKKMSASEYTYFFFSRISVIRFFCFCAVSLAVGSTQKLS